MLYAESCGTAAELYDPSTGTFSPTGSMTPCVRSGTATPLRDGRVLFAGGYNCAAAGQDGMWASASSTTRRRGTFSPTGSMAAPRSQHTATLLADGRVLIAGGHDGVQPGSRRRDDARLVPDGRRRFLPDDRRDLRSSHRHLHKTGSMSTPHRGHTATLLRDGRVLVVGNGGESSSAGRTADVYDPATGKLSRTGSMSLGRWLHTATLLSDGRVLILGGRTSNDSVRATAEMYDPRSGTFVTAGSMTEGRQQHTATLLQDGRVLIAGGYWSDGQVAIPLVDGDVRPGDREVQPDRVDGRASQRPPRSPERRPRPHRRWHSTSEVRRRRRHLRRRCTSRKSCAAA